jgi:hypothetical protein
MYGIAFEWDPGKDSANRRKQRSILIVVHTMREEYDFSGGVRGKYVDRYRRGTNVALLDPELAEAFPDSKSVNDALRALLAVATRADRRKRF